MGIDWITVSAQAINFLVLVWLLKRFLYQPVIKAMDAREQKIRGRMEDAAAQERAALKEAQKYWAKAAALKQQQEKILEQARQEARRTCKQMLDAAREDTARARANWMQEVREEKLHFFEGLRRQTLTAIEAIARKAIGDLADANLEACMVQAFIRRLPALDQTARESLAGASEPACIASSSELAAALQTQLTAAIQDLIGNPLAVTYTTNPDLGCGIELVWAGERISWNLSDYLTELDANIDKAFKPAIGERQEA